MSELFIFPSLVLHCEKKNVEIDFFQKCIVKSRKANLIFVGKRTLLQCVPIENYQDEMAVALKQCIFDPMLVKPKSVWQVVVLFFFLFLKNGKQTTEKSLKNKNYLLPNAFWLYQHGVKCALFKCFSHLLLIIFNRNTL